MDHSGVNSVFVQGAKKGPRGHHQAQLYGLAKAVPDKALEFFQPLTSYPNQKQKSKLHKTKEGRLVPIIRRGSAQPGG
jgi:hypothetical protein